jgi:hypothetical protein
MPIRVVMVKFKPGVTQSDVAKFTGWLHTLASRVPYLVGMKCGPHRELSSDAKLSANAPHVVFGDFASIWEFASEEDLDRFVKEPFHREIAGKDFRRLVDQRYVINIP